MIPTIGLVIEKSIIYNDKNYVVQISEIKCSSHNICYEIKVIKPYLGEPISAYPEGGRASSIDELSKMKEIVNDVTFWKQKIEEAIKRDSLESKTQVLKKQVFTESLIDWDGKF